MFQGFIYSDRIGQARKDFIIFALSILKTQ